MSSVRNTTGRRAVGGDKRPLYARVGFWLLIVVTLLVIVAATVVATALVAKDRLESVVPLTSQLRKQVTDGDTAAARETALEIEAKTGEAALWLQNPAWRASEVIPAVGANFTAVRVAAESADLLAREAIVPASTLEFESLKPVNRVFDIPAIEAVRPVVVSANDAVGRARDHVSAIDRGGLIDGVRSAVDELQSTLDDARGLTEVLSAVVQLLPEALGSSEPQRFLMVFQNNAEVRAGGGNPAALLLMSATNGEIAIERQASSADFPAKSSPIVSLDPETQAIFGDDIGLRLRDATMTPDFPEAASLVSAWWQDRFDQEIDGVLSFDPVALSYLIKASPAISLPSGELLDASSTVPLLLSEVYARFPNPADQDAVFAAVSAEIFTKISSGESSLTGLMPQLATAADEGRLSVWSANPADQALLAGTTIGGTLPSDNVHSTVAGVYFNDFTKYKMSYYLDSSIVATCDASGVVEIETTLVSSAPEGGEGLPDYVVGPESRGSVSTDVVVYGPIGSTLDVLLVDGVDREPLTSGTIEARPVVRVPIVLAPGARAVVETRFSGATGELGALDVRATPMARETPVTVSDASTCG